MKSNMPVYPNSASPQPGYAPFHFYPPPSPMMSTNSSGHITQNHLMTSTPASTAMAPGHHSTTHFSMQDGRLQPSPSVSGPPHHMFVGRRFPPHMYSNGPSSLEFRIIDLNKRMQQRPEDGDNIWWDSFTSEFFEDDATLTLAFTLEDGPKRFTIGRPLIPRYFRSVFEDGVSDMFFQLKQPRESFTNVPLLESDPASIITYHNKPSPAHVIADCRIMIEFAMDENLRIRALQIHIRQHREFLPRSYVAAQLQQSPSQDSGPLMETLNKNITRQGLTNHTLNYLRLCVILEPMQELMSRHKTFHMSPRECLKTILFYKWQKMTAPVTHEQPTPRPTNKRRKRKASSAASNGTATTPISTTAPSNPPATPLTISPSPSPGTQRKKSSAQVDVLVVGEPSLMGGELGDEDERLITRLENQQFDTVPSSAPPQSATVAAAIERSAASSPLRPDIKKFWQYGQRF